MPHAIVKLFCYDFCIRKPIDTKIHLQLWLLQEEMNTYQDNDWDEAISEHDINLEKHDLLVECPFP